MISVFDLKNNPKEISLLKEIEQKILKANDNNQSFIIITVGDWNLDEFISICSVLVDKGYMVTSDGCSGWTSIYYKISW